MYVKYIIYHVHTLCNIESIFLLIILYDIMFEIHFKSTNTKIAVDQVGVYHTAELPVENRKC